jgi:hypothetical protein
MYRCERKTFRDVMGRLWMLCFRSFWSVGCSKSWAACFGCLQVMESMQNFTSLQELWLGRNRIKVVNLCGLKCIKKLSLQSNRLTSMKGFEVLYRNCIFNSETNSWHSSLYVRARAHIQNSWYSVTLKLLSKCGPLYIISFHFVVILGMCCFRRTVLEP